MKPPTLANPGMKVESDDDDGVEDDEERAMNRTWSNAAKASTDEAQAEVQKAQLQNPAMRQATLRPVARLRGAKSTTRT